ncbi:M15 family metallopeptidase [Micromonospora sp. NBC_01655]|uniref:M15 family metallopeptidase n=1 Tax=Micromonospora sp. NBC_01655 TaxID=2975983 RepID=UPI0022512BB3|nr:M15 family metallopeptidase [Micromonospora sp. NBC_01655]MCX4468973.1 M15 family metallopeptidase [Micromonospora sp. NBC_01655]
MPLSQNGWKAGSPEQIGGLDTSKVAGVAFPQGVRRGPVATVLHFLAYQLHTRVEPLHPGWCWGYHYKQIEGSDDLSNHASGTAVDFNAPEHPMGKRNTFSPAQRAEIRKILAELDGVVRWGGDYTGRPDDMHFEIVGSVAQVERLAARLAGKPTPTQPSKPARPAPGPEITYPLPKRYFFGPESGGDQSVSGFHGRRFAGHTDRYWLQTWANQLRRRGWSIGQGRRYLTRAGNDGRFGTEYNQLVRAFQRDQGLQVDGELGPRTWQAAYRNPIR